MSYTIGQVEDVTIFDNSLAFDTIKTVVTSDALPFEIFRYTPKLGEKGYVELYYNCCDNTGAGVIKKFIGQYRKSNAGTITGQLLAQTTGLTADTGMGTATCGIQISGADIILTVTGISGKDMRHEVEIIRNSITLDSQ